jgi:flagellar biosynthesis/type III secretory pathway M-ring protein FliF/YscJ
MNQLVCIPVLTLSLFIIYNHINDRIRRLENECRRYETEREKEREKERKSEGGSEGESERKKEHENEREREKEKLRGIVVDNNRLIRIEVSIYNEILGIRDTQIF